MSDVSWLELASWATAMHAGLQAITRCVLSLWCCSLSFTVEVKLLFFCTKVWRGREGAQDHGMYVWSQARALENTAHVFSAP